MGERLSKMMSMEVQSEVGTIFVIPFTHISKRRNIVYGSKRWCYGRNSYDLMYCAFVTDILFFPMPCSLGVFFFLSFFLFEVLVRIFASFSHMNISY